MRDYRFRGKTINGDWVYGNLSVLRIKSDFNNIQPGHYISNPAGMPFAFQVIPETVGQFTGLKDKNGIEIYEGDKVCYTDWDCHAEDEYMNEGICLYDDSVGAFYFTERNDVEMDEIDYDYVVVIGSIHDK